MQPHGRQSKSHALFPQRMRAFGMSTAYSLRGNQEK
jgi:hypothetical protein